jgi:hypothetical protein
VLVVDPESPGRDRLAGAVADVSRQDEEGLGGAIAAAGVADSEGRDGDAAQDGERAGQGQRPGPALLQSQPDAAAGAGDAAAVCSRR